RTPLVFGHLRDSVGFRRRRELRRGAIIFSRTWFSSRFFAIGRRFADSSMKCPSLHLWVPRGYPVQEENHEPRPTDSPATVSPPPTTPDDRRPRYLPSHPRAVGTRPGEYGHRCGHPARDQSAHGPRLDRYLSAPSRPGFLGHPLWHR